jgi:hypothetical protein
MIIVQIRAFLFSQSNISWRLIFMNACRGDFFDTWFSLIFYYYSYFHLESRDVGSGKLYFYLRKAIFIPHNGKAFSLNVVDRKILLLMIYVKKQKLYKKNQPQIQIT